MHWQGTGGEPHAFSFGYKSSGKARTQRGSCLDMIAFDIIGDDSGAHTGFSNNILQGCATWDPAAGITQLILLCVYKNIMYSPHCTV